MPSQWTSGTWVNFMFILFVEGDGSIKGCEGLAVERQSGPSLNTSLLPNGVAGWTHPLCGGKVMGKLFAVAALAQRHPFTSASNAHPLRSRSGPISLAGRRNFFFFSSRAARRDAARGSKQSRLICVFKVNNFIAASEMTRSFIVANVSR